MSENYFDYIAIDSVPQRPFELNPVLQGFRGFVDGGAGGAENAGRRRRMVFRQQNCTRRFDDGRLRLR